MKGEETTLPLGVSGGCPTVVDIVQTLPRLKWRFHYYYVISKFYVLRKNQCVNMYYRHFPGLLFEQIIEGVKKLAWVSLFISSRASCTKNQQLDFMFHYLPIKPINSFKRFFLFV